MFRWKESEARLRRHAFDLRGAGASFKVHYWGVSGRLLSNPYHKHSFFEICYVLNGEGTYQDQETVHLIGRGTWFCSRPGIYHQIVTEGLALLFVAFEVDESVTDQTIADGFRRMAQQEDIIVMERNGGEHPASLLWKSLLIPEDSVPPLTASALPHAAMALILSFLPLFGGMAPGNVKPPSSTSALLNQARLFIRDNLSEPLTLPIVASSLNISERHLSRLFSSGIHETFSSYLRRERVRQAAWWLKNSDCSIKEIADRTGFGSVHYFTRTFHSLMSITPAKYREQAHQGD
ncbi:helix-turn-helix domain-containing protein [Paenibacillus allorhizosphaerae]|nr:AraC family transcriptional regulator [Paenibacillus allorhizosphaerae]